MKNAVRTWIYDPVLTNKKTSLHKHKMGARDSMLGYLISTRLLFWYQCLCLGGQFNYQVILRLSLCQGQIISSSRWDWKAFLFKLL